MKNAIYYFSGTGNSLMVANDLANELGNTSIFSIPKYIDQNVNGNCENMGIVFPVHSWGMPLIVSRFLKKLKPENAKYFFAIATYAGAPAGSLDQVRKQLEKQRIKLSSSFSVKMPTNYIILRGALSSERQLEIINDWNKRIEDIANIIRNNEEYSSENGSFWSNFMLSTIKYNISVPFYYKMDRAFRLNDKCNGCGICKSVCQVNNIEIKDGKPTWRHNCTRCYACIHWCPNQSIQIGRKTQNRERYTNPNITLKDFLNGKSQ